MSPSFWQSLFIFSFFSLWSLSALFRASTHIKWRAALRFQFRTHLWCRRPPTSSAVAEGTQGSPITTLYANVLAPGQQRGHAGTGSLFMQISGRQSQHRAGHRHWWSYLPDSTTASWENVANIKDMDQVLKYGRWSDRVKKIGVKLEVNINAGVHSKGI